jgi:hypothetical protein
VPDFDPQKVLIDWKESHGFTIADAQAGVSVMGATGSGKTSGPGALLARAYLKNGFGGLVLCAKPEFSRLFKQNQRSRQITWPSSVPLSLPLSGSAPRGSGN